MTIYTEEQLDGLKAAARVVSEVLRRMYHAEDVGDGSTLVGPKGSVTAQYEHTLVVGRQGPIVLTDLRGLP